MRDSVDTPANPGAADYGSEGSKRPARLRPSLRPGWLYPALTLFVIAVHAAYFASGIYWPAAEVAPLGSIDAELLPEGDTLDPGEAAPEGDALEQPKPPEEAKTEPEEDVAPLPESKDAEVVEKRPPPKKQVVEKPKPKPEEKKADAAKSGKRAGVAGGMGVAGGSTKSGGGRFGVAGGRGKGQGSPGATQATCLASVASSIRRHIPGVTALGPAVVYVTFYVNPGGGISGISTSGGSAGHAALARRIVSASRGPANCASAYVSQGITFQ